MNETKINIDEVKKLDADKKKALQGNETIKK
jgi:hypothetical protein